MDEGPIGARIRAQTLPRGALHAPHPTGYAPTSIPRYPAGIPRLPGPASSMDPQLTDDAIDRFRLDSYLALGPVLDGSAVQRLRVALDELEAGWAAELGVTVEEYVRVVSQWTNVWEKLWLVLPERERWERQLLARPVAGGSSGQYGFTASPAWPDPLTDESWRVQVASTLANLGVPVDHPLADRVGVASMRACVAS